MVRLPETIRVPFQSISTLTLQLPVMKMIGYAGELGQLPQLE